MLKSMMIYRPIVDYYHAMSTQHYYLIAPDDYLSRRADADVEPLINAATRKMLKMILKRVIEEISPAGKMAVAFKNAHAFLSMTMPRLSRHARDIDDRQVYLSVYKTD